MEAVVIPKEAKARRLPPSELIRRWQGPPPKRLVICSDNHFKLHHRKFQDAKLQFIEDVKPDIHVTAGDHWDFTNLSRYDKDPRFGHTLMEEFDSTREFEARSCLAAKRRIIIPGNHEERLWKTIMANHALFGVLGDFKAMARLPDKVEMMPYGTELQIGHVWIQHGDQTKTQNPTHWAVKHGLAACQVFGHHHRPGSYISIQRDGNGRMVRREAHCLGHGQDIKHVTKWAGTTPRWALGFGYVEQDGPDYWFHHIIANDRGEFVFNGKRYKG